jgi:hypothetical protein
LVDHQDERLRAAARATFDACYPSEERSLVGFNEAKRCRAVRYRQAVKLPSKHASSSRRLRPSKWRSSMRPANSADGEGSLSELWTGMTLDERGSFSTAEDAAERNTDEN